MQRVKIYININKMKELHTFRKFLAEGQLNEFDPMAPMGGDEAERDALLAALKSQYAKNVVLDGSFGRVALFGSGYDAHPLVNATAEIDSELALLKDRGLVDTDDYDVLMDDKAAAEEIAIAVKSLGGRVSYFSRAESDPKSPFYDPEIGDLEFVYSVNNKGELLGQAILR